MAVDRRSDPGAGGTARVLAGGAAVTLVVVLVAALDPGRIRQRGRIVRELRARRLHDEQLIERLQAELEHERTQQRRMDGTKTTAVGELAAAVAHEVNNPLTSVLGYADLLLATRPADDEQRQDLEIIRAEALQVRDRVRALLDHATRIP